MKILATMMALLFPISAFAGSCPSDGQGLLNNYVEQAMDGRMTYYSSSSGGSVTYYSPSRLPSCDSDNRTRAEATQCKIDYWQQQSEALEKSIREFQTRLDCIRERVAAFKREANK